MYNYIEYAISLSPFEPHNEIAVALLSELAFESFVEEGNTVKAYIPEHEFVQEEVEKIMSRFEGMNVDITTQVHLIPGKNWNEVWEKDFTPVFLNDLAIIAPFHGQEYRQGRFIEIAPKMSFGTGHHATTALMCNAMGEISFLGKNVLDMGTGTGVLAIYAEQLGATHIYAYDIEYWAVENARENMARNKCQNVKIIQGDIQDVTNASFDVILANINKNVHKLHLPAYAAFLPENGELLLSGFFTMDNQEMIELAHQLNLQIFKTYENNNWSCLHLHKK
jgi:ribosomal protein L11 methyltransferase